MRERLWVQLQLIRSDGTGDEHAWCVYEDQLIGSDRWISRPMADHQEWLCRLDLSKLIRDPINRVAWLVYVRSLPLKQVELQREYNPRSLTDWWQAYVDVSARAYEISADQVSNWFDRNDKNRTAGPQLTAKTSAVAFVSSSELPAVVLNGPGKPALVRGVPKRLTAVRYRVIERLVAAGPVGATKDSIESAATDARGILRRMTKSDTDWAAVIHMAGVTGGRYRID